MGIVLISILESLNDASQSYLWYRKLYYFIGVQDYVPVEK